MLKMDAIGHLLKSMGIPVQEIMEAGQRLITIAGEIKAQLDRIESRIANLEAHASGPSTGENYVRTEQTTNGHDRDHINSVADGNLPTYVATAWQKDNLDCD